MCQGCCIPGMTILCLSLLGQGDVLLSDCRPVTTLEMRVGDAICCTGSELKYLYQEGEMPHIVCPNCQGVNRVPGEKLSQSPRCGRCKASLFSARPIAVDASGFECFVGRSQIPLLVDFWAPWCGPCRMMAPAFEEAARRLEPAVQLLKVNTEEEQAIAARYGIRSIPTLMLIRDGVEVARTSGAMDAASLVAWTGQYL